LLLLDLTSFEDRARSYRKLATLYFKIPRLLLKKIAPYLVPSSSRPLVGLDTPLSLHVYRTLYRTVYSTIHVRRLLLSTASTVYEPPTSTLLVSTTTSEIINRKETAEA